MRIKLSAARPTNRSQVEDDLRPGRPLLPRTADLSASPGRRRRRSRIPSHAAGLFFPFVAQAQDLGAGGIPEEALYFWIGLLLTVGVGVLVAALAAIVLSWRRPPKPPQVDPKFRAYTRRSLR